MLIPDLSIIIVNWNVRDLLRDCLRSIYQCSDGLNLEVFVVDNASCDGSVEMVRKEFSGVRIIENRRNIGFPQANNQAIRQATGSYILLLNPDTVVKNNSLSHMIRFLEKHPGFGMVGPKVLNSDNTIQYDCAREFPTISGLFFDMFPLRRLFPGQKQFARGIIRGWDYKTSRIVPVISGACMLVRSEVLKQTKGLAEILPMYFEDIDLCKRAKNIGWKIYYLPEAEIIHYGGKSVKKHTASKELEAMQFTAVKIFLKTYCPKNNFIMVNIILITGALFRIITLVFSWFICLTRNKKDRIFLLATIKKYINVMSTGFK